MEIVGEYFRLSLVKDGDKYGLIDAEGNIVLPIEYDKFYSTNSYNEIKRENKWGIIDSSGKICLPAIWDRVYTLGLVPRGNIVVISGRKIGLYNAETGKEIIPVIMDEINNLHASDLNNFMREHFVVVSKGGKRGVFDLDGKEIIPIKYKVIDTAEYAYGCFEIRTFIGDFDCKYEYFTQEGILAFPLSDGLEYEKSPRRLACVKKNGKYGFINIKGDVVVPVVYDDAGYYDDGSGWVKQGSFQMRVDGNGKPIMKIKSLSSGEDILLSKDYGEPDAVTPWSALYLDKRILVTNEFIGGMYRRDSYRLAIINLDDIVCVVNEEGSIGSKYTRTFHTDRCSIEADSDDLSIGSTQHDYYDYMDPQSSFYIITKNRRYRIDNDYPSEMKTIWGWIVDYFKKK